MIASRRARLSPALILSAAGFLLLPWIILGDLHYTPGDDALRHVAKAITGRPFTDVLIMNDGYPNDHSPGWHAILGLTHKLFGLGSVPLLYFSILLLYGLFIFAPALIARDRVAWFVATGATLLTSLLCYRTMQGRPLLISCTATLIIFLIWSERREIGRVNLAFITAFLIAASVWIHGAWYLFALIPLSFLLAGAATDAGAIALCWIVGTLLGALLTGHAIQFLVQALRMVADCAHVPESQLQTEFKSNMETYLIALPICGLLLLRVTGKRPLRHLLRSPEFMLLITCFVLGLRNKRFWSDWGCLGLLLVIYREVHYVMEQDRKMRVLSVCLFAGLLFCVPRRFEPASNGSISKYVDFGANSLAPWCPAPGGTVYSYSQDFFYTHFFRFPKAKWKYVLGYEPCTMTDENLKVLRAIQETREAREAIVPWRQAMRAGDILVLSGERYNPSREFPSLVWTNAGGYWVGAIPGQASQP